MFPALRDQLSIISWSHGHIFGEPLALFVHWQAFIYWHCVAKGC